MAEPPRFTRGSTMRHVAVMTTTGAFGLMALFLVDVLNLFYISLLGQEELAAAIGFAGTLQFFMISISIGLSIGATAIVSRAIGAGNEEEAKRLAASSMLTLVLILSLVTAGVWVMRDAALGLLGAEGETAALASRFLAIVLPPVPFLGIAMVSGGLLRSRGDASRAMYVTLGGGALAAVLDPIFIFALDLGLDGAAIVTAMTRVAVAALGLAFTVGVHRMVGRLDPMAAWKDTRRLLAIAAPAVATQLSTPFGMAYLTGIVASHGDEAVAGWAVVGRLTALSFGGIFALSGAVGPIFGQNLGAGLYARLPLIFRDALLFAIFYVAVVWLVVFALSDHLIAAFGLAGTGAEVFRSFATFGTAAYVFTAVLFVSNACFNNLGRPTWSAAFNWSRDAVVIPVLAFLLGAGLNASGVILIQACAAALVGTCAAFAAWRYLDRFPGAKVDTQGLPEATAAPYASGRSALVVSPSASDPSPLAEPKKPG
ncbi:MAG: MATE family efflux transporter [Pseudomonadota bacterium]